jgi:uncharacterized NAD(P)/FAD-binding protein YdhS
VLQVDKDSARKELVLSERQAQLTEAVLQFQVGQVVKAQVSAPDSSFSFQQALSHQDGCASGAGLEAR